MEMTLFLKLKKNLQKLPTGSSCKELNPSGECCSKDIKNLIKLYSGKDTKARML